MTDDIPRADFPADLYDRLMAVLRAENPNRIAGRIDAVLDAAEALFALVVLTPEQHAAVCAELRIGLHGERGYEPKHIVRAIRILARNCPEWSAWSAAAQAKAGTP